MLALLIAVAGAHHRASQHTRSGAANERSMSYSHPINARHVVMGVFVLAGFAFVLLQLPLDSNPAMPSLRAIQENKEEKRATSILGSIDHNELVVLLSDITPISLSHDGAGARKQSMIGNGQVPHLTGFSSATFAPGDKVEEHFHESMDEVFYGEAGKGIFVIDGVVFEVVPGICIYVPAGKKHSMANNGDEDMVLLYFGIATGPALVQEKGK